MVSPALDEDQWQNQRIWYMSQSSVQYAIRIIYLMPHLLRRHVSGFLKEEFYQTYAEYLVKFLDEYKKNGLNMWAITTGNEPLDAFVPCDVLNTMGWTPETMGKWVGDNLGPTLASTGNNHTLIFALDDQRINLPWYPEALFRNKKALDYTSGIAIHWYLDNLTPATVLDETHDDFPEKLLLLTEASTGKLLDRYFNIYFYSY